MVIILQCREATLILFQSHKSLKKKQLLDELSGRGLTNDIKQVSAILKVCEPMNRA